MSKVALIKKSELSDWRSCQLITSNLEKAYLGMYGQTAIEYEHVTTQFNKFSAYELAKKIKSKQYQKIVWLEHKPCAAELLNALDQLYLENEQRPIFYIHLFGDFVLDCVSWELVESSLKKWPIKFIVSSHKQKMLVDSFFKFELNNSQVEVIPFPVDENQFNLENFNVDREFYRNKFDVKSDDLVLIYTGRISYQKNIEMLIKVFESLKPMFGDKLKLWIAGPWDSIFLPYAGKYGAPGSYFSQMVANVNINENKNLKFIGEYDSDELKKIYHAADCFISFSTFNDEDFGMSPAEALMMGLPCILSNWGGYSSFANYSDDVSLVAINFDLKRPEVQPEEARKIISKVLMTTSFENNSRELRASKVNYHLSLKSVESKLKKLSDMKVFSLSAFTPKFYKLCALSKLNPGSPFRDKNLELSAFYREVYEIYAN